MLKLNPLKIVHIMHPKKVPIKIFYRKGLINVQKSYHEIFSEQKLRRRGIVF